VTFHQVWCVFEAMESAVVTALSGETQVRVLAGRLARNTWRHPVLVSLNWVATLAVALGLGAVYWQVTRETGGIQNRRALLL